MYRCLDCGEIFEEPDDWVETHGLASPPYEHFEGCPRCHGGFEEYTEPELYDPDLGEVSKKIIESIFMLNNYCYQLKDMYGDGWENKNLDKAWAMLFEALDMIIAPEGMDRGLEKLIEDAKITDQSLKTAIDNFLEGAGLK